MPPEKKKTSPANPPEFTRSTPLMLLGIGIMAVAVSFLFYIFGPTQTPISTQTSIDQPNPSKNQQQQDSSARNPSSLGPKQNFELSPNAVALQKTNPGENKIERYGRKLIGDNWNIYRDPGIDLPTINRPDPNWEKQMFGNISRFQPQNVKVDYTHEESYLEVALGQGRFVEQVKVTYKNPDGISHSWRGLVDSETGTILRVWDRTHVEYVRPQKLSIDPENLQRSSAGTIH